MAKLIRTTRELLKRANNLVTTRKRGTATTKGVLMLLENNPYPQDGRVRREADALVAAGYRVAVIAPGGRGQGWRERVGGVDVYRFPAPPEARGVLGYLWEYGTALVATFALSLYVFFQKGFGVIHAHNPPDTAVLVAALYKPLGVKFVFDHHDLAPELYAARFGGGNRFVHRALLGLERLSCLLADHVLATNESYKKIDMQRGRVPEARITIVRNGPELSRMKPVAPDPALFGGKTVIGYVGEMGPQDGVDYLLRALRHLVYDLGKRDALCVLVGAGDAWKDLKSLAQNLQLTEHVVFTGWVDHEEVARYLSAADVCAAPEPFNPYNAASTMIKITEYMALGKPIVAFDLPEHRASAGEAALYVMPNDEFAFAEAIAQLVDDPARRAAMGACGRRRIEEELAWRYSVPPLLAAYQTLASKPDENRISCT